MSARARRTVPRVGYQPPALGALPAGAAAGAADVGLALFAAGAAFLLSSGQPSSVAAAETVTTARSERRASCGFVFMAA
jgi:hypothetical protein